MKWVRRQQRFDRGPASFAQIHRRMDVTGVVRLDVSDTGVGLSAEDQARVFERFYKQDASRSRGGTGLGLSIVRAIAEAHGGTATVRSTPGHGSTFSVTIPPDAHPPALLPACQNS